MTAPTDIPNHLVLFLYFVRFVSNLFLSGQPSLGPTVQLYTNPRSRGFEPGKIACSRASSSP